MWQKYSIFHGDGKFLRKYVGKGGGKDEKKEPNQGQNQFNRMHKIITFQSNIKKMVNTISIDFSVQAETSLGEQVYICGNVNQLGAWDINKALKLQTSKEVYPEWRNKRTLFFAENASLEFKIFIKNSQGAIRWQKIQGNRKFVPTGSVLISFTQSKHEMIFEPKTIREELGVRKNTFEIIHDLSDEVSQSSSGNQRQFWLERISKQRISISSSREFVAQAKSIYENWITDRSKLKQRVPNQWAQIIQSVHFIIKKGKNHTSRKQSFSTRDDIQILGESLNQKKSNIKLHELNINDLDNYVLAFDYPDSTLKLFHIYQEDWNEEITKKLERLYEGYFIIYMNRMNQNQTFIEEAQMISIKNKQVLKECLSYFGSKMNYHVSMIRENQFLIKKPNNESVIIYFSMSLPSIDEQFSISNEYLGSIQKNLLNQKNFPLPQNLKVSLMVQKHVLWNVHKQKFNIVVTCQKISQIPPKALNLLIRIASCENIMVYIMSSDEISQLSKKLPCSQGDKLLAYNIEGNVFKPEKKTVNLYEDLKISRNKYDDIFNQLKNKANFWIQNNEVTTVHHAYSFKFQCHNDCLGEQISQNFVNQFHKANSNVKFPYEIEKYSNPSSKSIIVQVRPTLSSYQFFAKVLTSVNMAIPTKHNFITFDFAGDLYKFVQKMEKYCNERKIFHEGFIMHSSLKKKGLKQEKFQNFLNEILTQSYSAIIQEDSQMVRRSKSKKSKDRNVIGSDFLN